MFKRIICAVLCLILVGSVLPAAAMAAVSENTYEVTVELPEGCTMRTNMKQLEGSRYSSTGGRENWISLSFPTPLVELDHWIAEGIELDDHQRTDVMLHFVMPENPVVLRAVLRESKCPYTDVSRDKWYYESIMGVSGGSTMVGTTPTTFEPEQLATRAQAVTILYRRTAGAGGWGGSVPFTDVPEGSWFYTAVDWAAYTNVTKGVSSTEFAPYAPVTRAQFINMLFHAMYWVHGEDDARAPVPFADVPQDAYYREALSWALAKGIVTGKTATTFCPYAPCTRAEIAAFLYRL